MNVSIHVTGKMASEFRTLQRYDEGGTFGVVTIGTHNASIDLYVQDEERALDEAAVAFGELAADLFERRDVLRDRALEEIEQDRRDLVDEYERDELEQDRLYRLEVEG